MFIDQNCDLIQFSYKLPQKLSLGTPILEVKHYTELPNGFLTYLNYNRMLRYDKFKLYPFYCTIFAGAFSFPSENFKKNPFFVSGFSFFNPSADSGWLHFDKHEVGFKSELFLKNLIKVRKFQLGDYYRDFPTTITHNFVNSKKPNYFLLSNNYVQPNNRDWGYRNFHINYFFDSVSRSRDVFKARRNASALDVELLFPVSSYNLISKGVSLVKFSDGGLNLNWALRYLSPIAEFRLSPAPAMAGFDPRFCFKNSLGLLDYLGVGFFNVSNFYKAGAFNGALNRFDSNIGSVLKFTRRGFKSKLYFLSRYKEAVKKTFDSLKFFNPLLNSNFVSSFESLDQFKSILKRPRQLKITRRRKFFLLRNKGFKRLKAERNANFYALLAGESSFVVKSALSFAYLASNRRRKVDRFFNKMAVVGSAPAPGATRLKNYLKKKKRLFIRRPSQFKLKSRRPRKGRSLPAFFKIRSKAASVFKTSDTDFSAQWEYFYRMARRHKSRFSRGRKFYKGFWSVSDRRIVSTRRRRP